MQKIKNMLRLGIFPLSVYGIAELRKLPANQHNYNNVLLLLFLMVFLVIVFGSLAIQERARANALEKSFNEYLELSLHEELSHLIKEEACDTRKQEDD